MQRPVLICRFNAHLEGAPFTIETDPAGGILLAATPLRHEPDEEPFALCLVADLHAAGLNNCAASATNTMENIVARWAPDVARFAGTKVQHIMWIELDSTGAFDHAFPAWEASVGASRHSATVARIEGAPLRSPTNPPRSAAAFLALWGDYGAALLSHTAEALGCSPAQLTARPAP